MELNFYLIFEILGITAFLLIFSRAVYQKNRQTIFELLAAFTFYSAFYVFSSFSFAFCAFVFTKRKAYLFFEKNLTSNY